MKTCGCGCSHDTPTVILRTEHRVIERVLSALEGFAAQERVDAAAFRDAIDFLRNFADGCHHAKEEDQLFPRLEAAGIPRDGGPIGCMLDEHAQGRDLIRSMADNLDAAARGDAGARVTLRAAATEYCSLLRRHIWKEDNVLFDLADRTLSPSDQQALLDGFDQAERAHAEPGKHERYLKLADELYARSLALAAPAAAGVIR